MSEDTEESQSIHVVTRLEDQDDDKEKEYSKGEYIRFSYTADRGKAGIELNKALVTIPWTKNILVTIGIFWLFLGQFE